MANYIIKNQIKKSAEIKKFCEAGYKFNQELSDKNNLVFCR
jgi:cytoplasmic iron level regulating protein YaaA (DUF328/UPF0246 family)